MKRFSLVALALAAGACFIPTSTDCRFDPGVCPGDGLAHGGGAGGGGPNPKDFTACRGGMVQTCLLDANGSAAVTADIAPTTVTIVEKKVIPFSGACAEFNKCYSNPTNNPVRLKLDGPGGPWFAVIGNPGIGEGAFDAGQQLVLRAEASRTGGQTSQAFSLKRPDAGFVVFGVRKVGTLVVADIAGTGVSIADEGIFATVADGGLCPDQIHQVNFTSSGGSTGPLPPGTSTQAGPGWYVAAERAVSYESDAGTCIGASEIYAGGSTQN